MKKHIIFTGALLLAGALTGEVMATCNTGTRVTNLAGTSGLLVGNTACDGSSGNWNAQEFHSGTSGVLNNLIDWKHGTLSTDPTAPVGTWSVTNDGSANATVTYAYVSGAFPASPGIPGSTGSPGATSTYTYSVWDAGSQKYDFCSDDTTLVTTVTIRSGQAACP